MSVLKIHHLGPITDCEINIKDFTILTGPQDSGKSTVAKAIFFFRTAKQDFYDQLTTFSADEYHSTLEKDLKKRLRSKFIQIFGTSWAMPQDMRISYEFSHWVTISVYLSEDRYRNQRNFVDFEFDEKIRDFIEKYKDYEKVQWDEDRLQSLKAELAQLFSDPYEIVYVPAGRSMITLLSDQLTEMLAGETIHTLDYCMRSYIRTIVSTRRKIGRGLEELLDTTLHTTQKKINREALAHLMTRINLILHAHYTYREGEERLILPNGHYVKLNLASSGQQESVWVLNLLYVFLLENKKVFLIMEEPEAHLYPDSQKYIVEALALFARRGNPVLLTTHSPYILGQLNNQLFAGELESKTDGEEERKRLHAILPADVYLNPDETMAYHVINGVLNNAVDEGLIRNELIDGVSQVINREMDALIDISWDMEERHAAE